MRTISHLDLVDASRAANAIREALLAANKAAVVAVADAHGDLLVLLRLDGAPASSVTIATNKAWTSAREGVSSKSIGTRIRDPNDGFDIAYYGDAKYIGWGGGLPVVVHGEVVGSIAVSGLPESEDEEFARIGLDVLRDFLRA